MPVKNTNKKRTLSNIHLQNPINNHYPNCIYLQIFWGTRIMRNRKLLMFDIVFNKQEKSFGKLGNMKFGISGGELILEIENGEMLLETRNYDWELPNGVSYELETMNEISNKAGRSVTMSPKIGVASGFPMMSLESGLTSSREHGTLKGQKEKFTIRVPLISVKGSPINPIWIFKTIPGLRILIGSLKNKQLGRVDRVLKQNDCRVHAAFKVEPKEVKITDVEGLLPRGLTDNKMALINYLIVNNILSKVDRKMSEGIIDYE